MGCLQSHLNDFQFPFSNFVELLEIEVCQFVLDRMARAKGFERLTCESVAFVCADFPNLAVVACGCGEPFELTRRVRLVLEEKDPNIARKSIACNLGVVTYLDRRDVFPTTQVQKTPLSLRPAHEDIEEGIALRRCPWSIRYTIVVHPSA